MLRPSTTLGLRLLEQGSGQLAAAILAKGSSSRTLAAGAGAGSAGSDTADASAGAAGAGATIGATIDPATGLPLSAPPPRDLRDKVEEVTM